MKKIVFIFLVLLIVTSVFLVSCKKKVVVQHECEVDSDCPKETCKTGKCSDDFKCELVIKENCCGNGKPEKTEDGQTGSSCTCPKDYAKTPCSGKYSVTQINPRNNKPYQVISKYLVNGCSEKKECKITVDKTLVQEKVLRRDIKQSDFTFEETLTFNDPFLYGTDKMHVKLTVKDLNEAKAKFPINFDRLIQMRGDELFGETTLTYKIAKMSDEVNLEFTPTYDIKEFEIPLDLKYKIEYDYTQIVREKNSAGETVNVDKTVEGSYQNTQKINLVQIPKDKNE